MWSRSGEGRHEAPRHRHIPRRRNDPGAGRSALRNGNQLRDSQIPGYARMGSSARPTHPSGAYRETGWGNVVASAGKGMGESVIEDPDKFYAHLEKQIDEFAALIGREHLCKFEGRCSDAIVGRGSPIEQLMAAALYYLLNSSAWYDNEDNENTFLHGFPIPEDILQQVPDYRGVLVIPECPVGKYRADFLVRFAHWKGGFCWAAIECDGHNHHDLTKDQASHDRERDRHFQEVGLLILRYPGSEIWRNPLKCATDALSIVEHRASADNASRWEK